MTKEQIEMLRCLIQGEIEVALQNENGYRFSFEQEKLNDQGWETFMNTFTKEVFDWNETRDRIEKLEQRLDKQEEYE